MSGPLQGFGVPESRPPERPSRPDPVRVERSYAEESWPFIAFAIILLAILAFFVFSDWNSKHLPDKRENRRYGALECVYNVDEDKIESCVAIYGG